MSSFSTNRKIALLIAYLRTRLKEVEPNETTQRRQGRRGKKRGQLSVEDLAERLEITQRGCTNAFDFTSDKTRELLRGSVDLEARDEESVLSALQALLAECGADFDVKSGLPNSLAEKFIVELPNWLRPAWMEPPIQGEELGGAARRLSGVWRFFFVAPTIENGEVSVEIHGYAALFRPQSPNQMEFTIVSKQRQWKGAAYVIAPHLYTLVQDTTQPDSLSQSAFFVTNVPTATHPEIVGTGVGLERLPRKKMTAGTVAVLCFGTKWRPGPDEAELQMVLEGSIQGVSFDDRALEKIRKTFFALNRSRGNANDRRCGGRSKGNGSTKPFL